MQCDFDGADAGVLEWLEVYRTNKDCKVLFILAAAFFALLDFLLVYRKRILAGKAPQNKRIVLLGLAAGVFTAFFPYLTDYFSMGADTLFHVTRIAGLKESLEQGAWFPVRLQSYWNYGHGYAVSLFYGDFFLLLPAILVWAGFPIMSAYKAFVFVMLAVTALISYHCFYRCVREEYAALFGSLIYLLAPYHIFNVYNRGAIGECLAIAFLPLVFCGVYLLYTEDVDSVPYKKYKWYLAWGLSAVLQSHVISTELSVVFIAGCCVALWKKTFRRQTFLQLSEAAAITLLFNMWFWLPMLYMLWKEPLHLQNVISQPIQQRGLSLADIFQILPNKGSAATGMFHCEPVQLGAGALILLAVFMLWGFYRKWRGQRKITVLMAALCLLTLLMSTKYLPWDAAMKAPGIGRLVSSLQFPGRWMVLSILFASLFCAFFFSDAAKNGGRLLKMAVGTAGIIAGISAIYHVNSIALESPPVFLYEYHNMGTRAVMNGEYVLEGKDFSAFGVYAHGPAAEEGLHWTGYVQRGTKVSLSLENTTDRLLFIEIPLTGYLGYEVKSISGSGSAPYIAEEHGGAHGDLKIAVPGGYRGSVSVSYQGVAAFRIAEMISVVSLAVAAGAYIYGKRSIRINEKRIGKRQ